MQRILGSLSLSLPLVLPLLHRLGSLGRVAPSPLFSRSLSFTLNSLLSLTPCFSVCNTVFRSLSLFPSSVLSFRLPPSASHQSQPYPSPSQAVCYIFSLTVTLPHFRKNNNNNKNKLRQRVSVKRHQGWASRTSCEDAVEHRQLTRGILYILL